MFWNRKYYIHVAFEAVNEKNDIYRSTAFFSGKDLTYGNIESELIKMTKDKGFDAKSLTIISMSSLPSKLFESLVSDMGKN